MGESKLVERVSELPWVRSLRVRHSRSSRAEVRDARPAPATGKMADWPRKFLRLPRPTAKMPEFDCYLAPPEDFITRPTLPHPQKILLPCPEAKKAAHASLVGAHRPRRIHIGEKI